MADEENIKNSGSEINEVVLTDTAIDKEKKRIAYRKELLKTVTTTIYVLILVAAIAVLISTIFMPVIKVSGNSMNPTLEDSDIVLLVKTDDLELGDLCCFYWNNKLLLKRVIGTPGDVIVIDPEGNLYVNGEYVDEIYIDKKSLGDCDIEFPYHVGDNHFFMLGDSREVSVDSRNSTIGAISEDQLVGKVVVKIWPTVKFY